MLLTRAGLGYLPVEIICHAERFIVVKHQRNHFVDFNDSHRSVLSQNRMDRFLIGVSLDWEGIDEPVIARGSTGVLVAT